MARWFKGIDFANRQQNIGVCYLEESDGKLTGHFDEINAKIERTAIDCPFGTSLGFLKLLHNQAPGYDSKDAYKTRHTERWLREQLWDYRTNAYWRENVANDPQHYVNQTAHVQPTLGLQIVPGFLDWFRIQIGTQFVEAIEAARRGESAYIESHPRAFLYSAIERIWRIKNLTKEELRAVAQYKDRPKLSHAAQRRSVYQLLRQHASVWLGNRHELADPPQSLLDTDHAFDAWLSALTAFAHTEKMTISWTDANIGEEEVRVEGHVLILRQSSVNNL